MKFTHRLFILTALLAMIVKQSPAQVLMPTDKEAGNTQLLNGRWDFKYIASTSVGSDSTFYAHYTGGVSWRSIKVPGHWELQGFAEPFYGKALKAGTGLYHKSFYIPSNWSCNPVYIAFDGVQFGYTFWINGQEAGSFASSYNQKIFEISKYLHRNKINTIAVRVSTHPLGWEFDTNDDWSLSGIVRNVTLFTLPAIHLNDLTITTNVKENTAAITLKGLISKPPKHSATDKVHISGTLLDPAGKPIKDFSMALIPGNYDAIAFGTDIFVPKPALWTAESPSLYRIQIRVLAGSRIIQTYRQSIGIRQVSWNNAVLKLNGRPIKLRGIDHHDLSPVNGRAITDAELKKDLQLAKEANINFIRTSHYPPNPRLLELCDSLGIYLMVEVPFGFGEEHLKDQRYLPLLKARADATIKRDKNHPCVIVWSIGNENPVTPITLTTARYVKYLDNTRPICFPQTEGPFADLVKNYPDSLDIYAPHYPTSARIKEYANKFNKPIIFTEYAHSLGLDFDLLESLTDVIWQSPHLAGGAIWDLFDQGILIREPKKVTKDEFTLYAWKDSVTAYDTHGNEGADGIVYANRIPQVDYFEVRKVYSPVHAIDDTLPYHPGKQQANIRLINRYDFTNLSAVKCRWKLMADTGVLNSGLCLLQGQPHDTVSVALNYTLPAQDSRHYYLKLSFADRSGYQFYEKTFPIVWNGKAVYPNSLTIENASKPVIAGSSIKSANYSFDISGKSGMLTLKNATGINLITDGPYARVGRKTTMSQLANENRAGAGSFWSPFVLENPVAKIPDALSKAFNAGYEYRPDSSAERSVTAKVNYSFAQNGAIEISYHLCPKGTGKMLESGLTFLLPPEMSEFRWIGKGPYAAYPGKSRLAEFGIFHLNSHDLYFIGNRQDVELAVFSDGKGNGFILKPEGAGISVERTSGGILVSHSPVVSGRFNKFGLPETLYNSQDLKSVDGKFILIPFSGKWPAAIDPLFGNKDKKAIPFSPFYNSYDR